MQSSPDAHCPDLSVDCGAATGTSREAVKPTLVIEVESNGNDNQHKPSKSNVSTRQTANNDLSSYSVDATIKKLTHREPRSLTKTQPDPVTRQPATLNAAKYYVFSDTVYSG